VKAAYLAAIIAFLPVLSAAAVEFSGPIVSIESRGSNFTGAWAGFDPYVERGSVVLTIATASGWKSLRIAKDDDSKKDMLAMALTSKTTGEPIVAVANGEWDKIQSMRMGN
jgi:hypothetical protein